MGYNYHIYVTDNGKAYCAGNEFARGIELECTNKDYKEIKFDEGVIPKKAFCCNCNETNRPALMMVDNNGKTELWSGGENQRGLLGQGDGKSESKKFAPMNYDKEKITFVDASIKYNFGLALTDKGELYGWGNNEYKCLGMSDTKNYFSPVEIPFFKDYYVHSFSCGDRHALVIASKRSERDKKILFSLGDIAGISTDGKTDEGILHIKQYDEKIDEIRCIEAGERT
jgi:hypothetical protein